MRFSVIIKRAYRRLRYLYRKYVIKNDEKYIRKIFKKKLKRELDLDNPILFNDKIQWLKLNNRNSNITDLSDKIKVREYVTRTIGEKYLNNIYGTHAHEKQIQLSSLPNKFVIKLNHGSGFNIIVKDKSNIDFREISAKLKEWRKTNYYYYGREWQYKNIHPLILIEEYLEDEDGELKDYKFFCFDGEPRFIQVDFSRFTGHKRNIYNLDWILQPFTIEHPNEKDRAIIKPAKLEEMIDLSRKLSKNLPFVRVDFYFVNNKIYFGEMTFTHGNGIEEFSPPKYEKTFGDLIPLQKFKKL
ncbi:hypothetical protein N7548_01480 [Acholeplasma manati]|uniref:Glycosyltransferase n=1 Tax=Paracholeplasma manati TaxID=591373 RepID=A0ABT2Y440_9MOLU|nr:ATP-grasp fold amidoligase family protein [Paracholeplasma manati]MCV2231499.1 hypothetical protein [Paracholeplasma manati]